MTHADRAHRRLDAAAAEAQARDGGTLEDGRSTVRSRDRARDGRSLGGPRRPSEAKVLLAVLAERTSSRGTRYLAGWLGKARVVGFLETDDQGREGWALYVSTPQPRE